MRRIIFALLVIVVGCTSVEEKGLSRPSLSISDAINRDVFVDSIKFHLIKTPEKGLQITESWIEKTKQCALPPSMNYQFVIKFDRRLDYSEFKMIYPNQCDCWGAYAELLFLNNCDLNQTNLSFLYSGNSYQYKLFNTR